MADEESTAADFFVLEEAETPIPMETSSEVRKNTVLEVMCRLTIINAHIWCSKSYHIDIANSRWLAKVFHNKIINNPKISWKQLKEEVKERYHLDVTLEQCGKAKKFALGEVDEIMRLHYAKLWEYAAEIRVSIPNSTVKIKVDMGHFQRIYVCLGPLKKCWREGCRPVFGVDGCFLKNYCKGELLTAIGRDGNNWMFPIAWAVVESETKEAWIWFLQLLSDDLFLDEGRGFTIVSDQQKGLESMHQGSCPRLQTLGKGPMWQPEAVLRKPLHSLHQVGYQLLKMWQQQRFLRSLPLQKA